MAISRMKINNTLWNGNFSVDFGKGVNVIIGENASGKTTLLTWMYDYLIEYSHRKSNLKQSDSEIFKAMSEEFSWEMFFEGKEPSGFVYYPEKDLLSHSYKLPESVEYGGMQFLPRDIDIVKKARVAATKPPSEMFVKISEIIGGEPRCTGEKFYVKSGDAIIQFHDVASGHRKFAALALLLRNEQIKPGTVLFWDEPENSLNPELVPKLVEILLELADSGVQIILATHDYNLARYFDVRKDRNIPVAFHNLSKVDGQIFCNSSPTYLGLPNNLLEKANADLFDAVVDAAMEVQDDE